MTRVRFSQAAPSSHQDARERAGVICIKTRVNALLGRPPGRRDALQATRAGFDSQSVHQFIPVNRPWWMGLTVNQDAAGSNPATGANCDVLLAARHLRSQRSNMGSSPIRRTNSSRSSIGRAPGYEPGGMQVRSLSGRPIQQGVAQTGQSSALGMRRSEVRILSP